MARASEICYWPAVRIPSLLPFVALIALCCETFAQSYGLTSRPNVAPYLDDVMPPQPPAIGTDWSAVVAFQDLTFLNPMGIVQMPGQNRMVVWEREGRVFFFDKDEHASAKTLMIDVSNQCQGWDDSGLMAVAFHPNFSLAGGAGTNRYVFIYYTWCTPGTVQGNANNRPPTNIPVRDRLSRFTLDANGVAVPGSETVFIDQNGGSVWHNGGGMFFHPDNGFLYVTDGDDGSGGNTQHIDDGLFSGVWRIDVDQRGGNISHPAPRTPNGATVANYFIPNDNPFVGVANANEEFFCLGLRSPHRMTIDPVTKRIFIGDVGAGSREEISVIEPNEAGLNFQWDRIEGFGGDLTPPYVGINKRPVLDYGHNEGSAIIGGYVYRGAEFAAELGGRYLFGDNITNNIYVMDESTVPAGKTLLTTLPKGSGPNAGNDYVGLSSFGVDAQGVIYLCQLSSVGGQIYKLQRGGTASQPLPATLSATGVFSNTATMTPSGKIIPYALNQPFWSDGAIKSRWASVPNTANVGFTETGEWSWPEGTVMVKHFDLPVDDTNPAIKKRLETRLLVKMASGSVYGATYKWRADNNDADLLDSALTENVPVAIAALGALAGADIGSPALSGSTVRSGDVLTLQAGGTDIWGTADQFHFASQQRTGDFDISVRIESLSSADLYSKAGLMARESLASDSRHVFALAFPDNSPRNNNDGGYEFQYRTTTGGTSAAIYPPTPQPRVSSPQTWLRLRREGDAFIAYSSSDGAVWGEFARRTLALPETLYFGVAATSHTAAARTTAVVHLQTTRLQPWYYPSRQNCVTCHTTNAGGVLGPKTRQLNGDLLFPNGVTDNQLRAWAHVGLFDNPPAEAQIANLDKLAALNEAGATLEKRARSYLDANCASCHRPGGAQAFWDARFDTPLAQQGLLYGILASNLGDPTARVIVPQDLARSVLHRRVNSLGATQMPPLAKNRVDTQGAAVLAQWIASLAPNAPPIVALTNPANGAVILQGTPIALAAIATDGDGIQRVEFYNGLTKLGQDTTAPYEFTWNNASRGAHALTAIAIDAVGNSAQSALVNVSVQGAPLPAPWLHGDIGNVGIAGDASFGGGIFNVSGSGDDIWGGADEFHFVHRQLTGDGEIVARVVSLQNTDGWAKVGVMMRESLAADSAYAFSMLSPGNGDAFQRRGATGAGAEHNGGQGASAPFWVRLVRAGNMFTAYSSATNGAWQAIGAQTIPMASTIYVGLAVTAHNNGALNEAAFSDVTVGGSGNVAPTVALTQPANGARFVDVPAITFAATASDSDGSIDRVEFLVDGAIVGQSINAPYAAQWSSPSYGTHVLAARAVDNGGATATASATIAVENTGAPGFRAEYFDNMDFTAPKFIRTDAAIDFGWGGGSPDPRIAPDTFSVRWSGRIRPRFTETYTFTTTTDDGVRLWVNGQLIIDKWINQSATNWSGTLPLIANQSYDVVMEFFENGGDAVARLRWSSASQAAEAIPASRTTVPNPVNQPPVVTLTAPADGATFLDTDTISLSATASDPDGYVSRVEFWANGVKLGQTGGTPFTLPWSGLHGVGGYSLSARAVDAAGLTAATPAIVVQTIPLGLTPASVQRLTNPDRMVSTLHFAIPAGRNYTIEWSDDLGTWHPLAAGTSTGTPIDYTDTAAGVARRFFRLLVD